ncbi:MAG: hypothetical protein HFH68_16960 [Lachnospiraceae bacterium]|nr:hypothetical protein [Lachnospiraceae bacterium]
MADGETTVTATVYVKEIYQETDITFHRLSKRLHYFEKNKLTGGGNTTSIVAKYIHTYQSITGAINISLNKDGFGTGFALSDCPQQWSLVASLSGIKY